MFSSIMDFYNSIIQHLSGGDPVAKGLVTVWLLSTVGFLVRKVPQRLKEYILHHTTVSMTFSSNGQHGNDVPMFFFVEDWLIKNNRWSSRSLNHATVDAKREELRSFSNGTHWVLIGLRLYKVIKTEITTKGTASPEFRLTLETFGRDVNIINDIVRRNKVRDSVRYYYTQSTSYGSELWELNEVINDKKTIFLDAAIKEELDRNVIFFRDNKDWYIKNNQPYKLTIALYGEPGTGKTSLIRYISDLLNSDLHSMSLATMRLDRFEQTMRSGREGVLRVVAIEDFEKYAKKREPKKPDAEEEDDGRDPANKHLTLDILLNTLQGIYPLENVVTVMTTNHIDMVDPAVIRNGRTDLKLEIGRIKGLQVSQYYEHNYGRRFPLLTEQVKDIKACDMHELFRNNPISPEGFINQLKREGYVSVIKPQNQDQEEETCNCLTL